MKARWNIMLLAVTLFFSNSAYSISVGERSTKDYYFTTKVIREIKPMVTKFKNDDNQTKIESITKMYEEAALIILAIIRRRIRKILQSKA
jgi:hypothetical protein